MAVGTGQPRAEGAAVDGEGLATSAIAAAAVFWIAYDGGSFGIAARASVAVVALWSLTVVAVSSPISVDRSSVSGASESTTIPGPSGRVAVPDTRDVGTSFSCKSTPARSSPERKEIATASAEVEASG